MVLPSLSVLRPLPQHWKSTRWNQLVMEQHRPWRGKAWCLAQKSVAPGFGKSYNENGIMVYYWCSRLLRHQCWTGLQLLGQIFQESLTWDGSKTEVGERGCNLQLVKLEKYSIQVLNSIKQYRIFWKILVKLEIFPNSPSTAENQKSLKPLPTFFQLKFTLTYLNVKRQNANRALLLQCQCNSMTSRCSSQSCWLSMLRQGPVKPKMSNHVKPCQTMSNPRAYNAICANI